MDVFPEPPRWRWRRHREWRAFQERERARDWMQASWEWSQRHPGVPLMEAYIGRDESWVSWNGPAPGDIPSRSS